MIDKKSLRCTMKIIRSNIANKEALSRIINEKIINLSCYQKASVIAIYKSLPEEVDTSLIINHALNSGKIILLPRVVGDNLLFYEYVKDTPLKVSKFNILEPFNDSLLYKGKIDLIIVPGLAFDEKFNRLGYGKGYYDRFLNGKDIYKIGICFDEQLCAFIPCNELDVNMDRIITSKKDLERN